MNSARLSTWTTAAAVWTVLGLVACAKKPVVVVVPPTPESQEVSAPDSVILSTILQSARERGWALGIVNGRQGWLSATTQPERSSHGGDQRVRWYFSINDGTLTVHWRVDERRLGRWELAANDRQRELSSRARLELWRITALIAEHYHGPRY